MGIHADPTRLRIDGKSFRLKDLKSSDDRPKAILLLDWESPAIDPNTAYCFTSDRALQKWLDQHKGRQWHRQVSESIQHARLPLRSAQAAIIRRAQAAAVKAATSRFQSQ